MKITTAKKRRWISIVVILSCMGLSLALVSVPSDTILNTIGSQNAYLLMFVLALVGSISTFAGIPYPLFLISFAAGGINPIGLA
ncbi:MAG: hypothetical protein AAFO91_08905, partial [Bacteroidota bacterium]